MRWFLLLGLLACHRNEAPRSESTIDASLVATRKPVPAASSSVRGPTMTPELRRVLDALRSTAGDKGETRGTFADLRRWIGDEAKDWPLARMLKELEDLGEISIHVLSEDAGADPQFVLDAWKR